MSNFLKTFNAHLVDFMNDLLITLNDEDRKEMETYKLFVENIIKTNAVMIVKLWHKHVVKKFLDKIENNDFDFFLNKDYDKVSKKKNIENLINKIKKIVREMDEENKAKSMKYIKNLCKISQLYINK